jgi:hypothetical protein
VKPGHSDSLQFWLLLATILIAGLALFSLMLG